MEVIIRLNQLHFHAPVGWYAEERLLGNSVVIDLELKVKVTRVKEDELVNTVDYESVYALVKKIVLKPAKLLETLCGNIAAEILLRFKEVIEVKVITAKIHPPVGGIAGSSSVEVREKRK